MDHPTLETLMAAYYHQDWPDQGGIWGTLDLYRSHVDQAECEALRLEIADVLETFANDSDVGDYLERLGSYVLRDSESGGYRGWLEEISRRISVGA